MKEFISNIVAKIVLFFVKLYFGYYVIITFSFFLITFCYILMNILTTDANGNSLIQQLESLSSPSSLQNFFTLMTSELPLADLFDSIAGDSGGIVEIFQNLSAKTPIKWSEFQKTLFPDFVLLSLAQFIVYWFRRPLWALNNLFNGVEYRIAFFITSTFLAITGFIFAVTLMKIADTFIPANFLIGIKTVLLIFCLVVHAILLSNDSYQRRHPEKNTKKSNFFSVLFFILKDLFFGVINSIFIWFICSRLHCVYAAPGFEIFAFALSFWAFALILEIEKNGVTIKK